jgi:hypothetical protein
MLNLEQLKNNTELINLIDWEMTPEEAVRLYLEWGNNWVHGKYVIRSDSDVSVYFIVYAWDDPPVIYLIRRSMKETEELAKIYMPENLRIILSMKPAVTRGFINSTARLNHG